jgi:hypothetical protein
LEVVSVEKKRMRTITEERLHPEEALFLHLRGLLDIVVSNELGGGGSSSSSSEAASEERNDDADHHRTTLTTRDLFCRVLPECNVPLAAYLAYAHLREQGYILIRYAERRMRLLLCMTMSNNGGERRLGGTPPAQTNDAILPPSSNVKKETTSGEEEKSVAATIGGERGRRIDNIDHKVASESGDKKRGSGDDTTRTLATTSSSSEGRFKSRALRLQLSDDVAMAPPPCVVSLDNNGGNNDGCTRRPDGGGEMMIRLAYYAYNPNSHFRRSDPGLPDFGVAVMPYNDDSRKRPTFDVLSSLVSMCEGGGGGGGIEEDIGDAAAAAGRSGIPLRVVTVADGGAVVAFGVTKGEVPSI